MAKPKKFKARWAVWSVAITLVIVIAIYFTVLNYREHERKKYLKGHPEAASPACAVLSRSDFNSIFDADNATITPTGNPANQCDYNDSDGSHLLQIALTCGQNAESNRATLKTGETVRFGKTPHTFMTGDGDEVGEVGLTLGEVFISFTYHGDSQKTLRKVVQAAYKRAKSIPQGELCKEPVGIE